MLSTRPLTSKSSSPFNNPLVTVPKAPIKIGIIVTCMFHSFFNSLARSRYYFFFSYSISFILWSPGTAKSKILQILFFFFFVIIVTSLRIFHTSFKLMVFHWSLNDSKSLHISMILFNILADFNNAVVWIPLLVPFFLSSPVPFPFLWWL